MSTSWQDASKTLNTKDIAALKKLSKENPLEIILEKGRKGSTFPLNLTLYQFGKSIPLSDIVPLLENMGLHTDTEHPMRLTLKCGTPAWCSTLDVACLDATINNPLKSADLFCEAILAIRNNHCENDALNHLVLGAGINWQEVALLRAYTRYLLQARFRFTQPSIEKTLSAHPEITRNLVRLFLLRFEHKSNKKTQSAIEALEEALKTQLETVKSLDEDTILRRFWELINATLRTNYFLGKKQSISLKLDSNAIPELPEPHPMFEIFVYSPRFEGIHLRKAKIARGGLRWSDRLEDFRTEILNLMKAQQVKNAIIVPSGAKGGFILKKPPINADRAALQKEVIACYKRFIRGLLDITDNIKDGKTVSPANVICHDSDDPYLVVAADKGTSSFSDVANEIANEYEFWLGDAFASGGSAGYDHKKIGITARGAWESAKRHLRELAIDLKTTPITIAGIGDMSGDVFGNGLLYSNNLCLVAAFDHRDIFLDPNPDPKESFKERKRLFALPTSSWQDYTRKLISKGGGVYSRTAKSIPLSTEIRKCLGVSASALPPMELIRVILKAPVDMLYNGGIGTYVKASTESNAEIGDRGNILTRVNASDLRCKVVCEGGNLGLTQPARIEYNLAGGLISADFIDNSAGVDCSDHEVNLKILLNAEVASKKLSLKKRNQILANITDDVANHVLQDNYDQALAMSFSAGHAVQYLGLYQNFIRDLESKIDLDRVIEYLPDEKKLLERKAEEKGLARPELGVLLAYTKIHIKNEILESDLPNEPWFLTTLENSFPGNIGKAYNKQIQKHPLYREIIATSLANNLVNTMGITFVYRLQAETGMPTADIVRAYCITSTIYETEPLQKQIDGLDMKISAKMQFELLHYVRQLLNLSSRWFVREARLRTDMTSLITHYAKSIKILKKHTAELISGATKAYMDHITEEFEKKDLPHDLAHEIALSRVMYTALNVTEIATRYKFDLLKTASVYFDSGSRFGLVWFRDQIASDHREGYWNNRARLALRDELDKLQRRICITVMEQGDKKASAEQLISHWLETHPVAHSRWKEMLETVHDSAQLDYTLFFIALRELWGLIAESEAVTS